MQRYLLSRNLINYFSVRWSLALMLRVVRVGQRCWWGRALQSPLHTQQVPGPGCTRHWTQCIDHASTPPSLQQRAVSSSGCSSLSLFSLRLQWCWDGGSTWSGSGHPHLRHTDTPSRLTRVLAIITHQSPDISWSEHWTNWHPRAPICIARVMRPDQAEPRAFLVTKYTTERWAAPPQPLCLLWPWCP